MSKKEVREILGEEEARKTWKEIRDSVHHDLVEPGETSKEITKAYLIYYAVYHMNDGQRGRSLRETLGYIKDDLVGLPVQKALASLCGLTAREIKDSVDLGKNIYASLGGRL